MRYVVQPIRYDIVSVLKVETIVKLLYVWIFVLLFLLCKQRRRRTWNLEVKKIKLGFFLLSKRFCFVTLFVTRAWAKTFEFWIISSFIVCVESNDLSLDVNTVFSYLGSNVLYASVFNWFGGGFEKRLEGLWNSLEFIDFQVFYSICQCVQIFHTSLQCSNLVSTMSGRWPAQSATKNIENDVIFMR